MYTFKALTDTYLKKETLDSSELPDTRKKLILKDDIILVDKAEIVGNHLLCTLSYKAGDWYIFTKHWSGVEAIKNKQEPKETKRLKEEDYKKAADKLRCEVNIIKAVVKVESNGSGFLSNGFPKILFEAHHFSKLTNRRFDQIYPNISSRNWNRRLYKGGILEWDRLNLAMRLDRTAAIQSASYGLMQILGSNYKACGYKSPEEYYKDQFISEAVHLDCFVNFIITTGLDKHLRSKNFTDFARGYNGPSFATNFYHIKLQQAYNQFLRQQS